MTKRQLTEKQQAFMAVLFEEAGGDVVVAKRLAGYSDNSPTTTIVEALKDEARTDAMSFIKEIQDEAKINATKEAKRIVIQSIQRVATEQAIENSVSVFNIDSDEINRERMLVADDWTGTVDKCESCLDKTSWFRKTQEWKLYEIMLEKKDGGDLSGADVAFYWTAVAMPLVSQYPDFIVGDLRPVFTSMHYELGNYYYIINNPEKMRCAMYQIMRLFCHAKDLQNNVDYIAGLSKLSGYTSAVSNIGRTAVNNFQAIRDVFLTEFTSALPSPASFLGAYSRLATNNALFIDGLYWLQEECGIENNIVPLPQK